MEKGKGAASTSLLSKNVKIEGEVQGAENLHVEGRFKGSIKINGNIFVGHTGVVEAEVEAENVVIQGRLTGSVLAHKILEIQSSGKLIGDCTAQSMDIKEGAVFEGRSKMLKNTVSPAGPGAAPGASVRSAEKNLKK